MSSADAPSTDADLPPALSSMWRLCKIGYQHEPALMSVAFGLALVAALPEALLAIGFKAMADAVLDGDATKLRNVCLLLGAAGASTWFLTTVSTRVQRRFRDKVTIGLESHVARLQASVTTIAHQERPEYLDRLSVLRDQVFVLDHMYMSVFSTAGWILRLGVTIVLLASVSPVLILLALFAVPTVATSSWRPTVEREVEEAGAPSRRLAEHLFATATTAAPAKEVRVTGIADRLQTERREAWEGWYGPWPRPEAHRPCGTRWAGRSSAPASWAPSSTSPRGSTPRPRTCSSSWPPAPACRPTSRPPWARSASSGASGWTAPDAWPGWRTMPPPSRRTPTSRSPTGSMTASPSSTSASSTPGRPGRSSRTSA